MYPAGTKKFLHFLLDHDPKQAVFLIGHARIGKTMCAKQVAREAGTFYVRLNATGMDNTDIIGLPKIEDWTTWKPPKMLKPLETDEKCVLILDEINRVPPETRHVLMQMLDEREVGELKLGPNVLIVVTANPDDPGYQVDDMDLAFMGRCCVLPFEFHWDSFQSWALSEYKSPIKGAHEGQPLSPRVMAAAQRNKAGYYREIKSIEKYRQLQTPDGTVKASELDHAGLFEYGFKEDEIIQILAGLVGPVLATSIVKDLNAKLLDEYKLLLDALKPLPTNVPHPVQIDLLYYVWEQYGSDPVKHAKNIHHLFMQVNNDIKLLMVRLCGKFFIGAKTKAAFAPMKADWKKVCSEIMLRAKNVDEDEIRDLLNSL